MSVRDRLAAKARRRVTVPVQVSDPGPARSAFEKADRTHTLLQMSLPEDADAKAKRRVKTAQTARDKARAEYVSHFEEVEFQAGSPVEVEAVLGAHTTKEGNWDQEGAVAPLAALCAVDEDLHDEAWWAEQFTSGTWSAGERQQLWLSLLDINVTIPSESLPKD